MPDEDDETNESDMIGEESDEDVPPAASHRQSLEQTAERQGGLSRPKQSGSNEAKIHKGKGEQPAEAAAGSAREQQNPIRQQNLPVHSQERLHSPAGASAAAASGSAHVAAASSDGVEGTAGKKLPHGKPHRSRPPSRMQRIAAEVQARKVPVTSVINIVLVANCMPHTAEFGANARQGLMSWWVHACRMLRRGPRTQGGQTLTHTRQRWLR